MDLETDLTESQIKKVLPYYIYCDLNLGDRRLAKLRIVPFDSEKVKQRFIFGICCLLFSVVFAFCFFYFGIYDLPLYISIPVFAILGIFILLSGRLLNPCIVMVLYRFVKKARSKSSVYHVSLCDAGVYLPAVSNESEEFYEWDLVDSILYTSDLYILQINTPRTPKTGSYRIAIIPTEKVSPDQLRKWIGPRSIPTSQIDFEDYPLWY